MRALNADTTPRVKLAPIEEPETHVFEIGDRTFVLDCNSLALFEVEDAEEIKCVAGVKQKPVFAHRCNPMPQYVVLEACHTCNFNCSYCMLQQYEPGAAVMSAETAEKAIDALLPDRHTSTSPPLRLGFFGGEPLCNWDMIREIVPWFEGSCLPRRPRFHITTNGSLITRDKAKFMKEHNFSFIVSLDGPEHIHNQCRVYKSGNGTFREVMKGLRILHDFGLSHLVTLRATFTPENADTQLERIKYLNELKYKGYANWVSIEPAFLAESLCADSTQAQAQSVSVRDMAKLRGSYGDVAEWYVSEIREGRKPVLHFFHSILQRLLYGLPHGTECGAGAGYVSVNGKGEIFACHREQSSFIGHLDNGGIDPGLRAKWLDARIYLRRPCRTCFIRHVCGGGCRERSIGEHDDIRRAVEVECQLKLLLFRTAVWILAELGPEVLSTIVPLPTGLRPRPR